MSMNHGPQPIQKMLQGALRDLQKPIPEIANKPKARKEPWRRSDTLVPARFAIALVNVDRSFLKAQEVLGFEPKGAYRLVEECGLEQIGHVKKVVDFICSIMESNPWFFCTDRKGQTFTRDQKTVSERAIKCMWTMCTNPRKPILEKYAGRYYFETEHERETETDIILEKAGYKKA